MGYIEASFRHYTHIGSRAMEQNNNVGIGDYFRQWREIMQTQGIYDIAVAFDGELQERQTMRRGVSISLNVRANLCKLRVNGDNVGLFEDVDGLQQLLGTIDPRADRLLR